MKFEYWLIPLFVVASILHGIAGMGFPLITIGVLSGIYGLTNAIILVLVPTAVLNLIAWLGGGTGGWWHNFSFYLKKYWLSKKILATDRRLYHRLSTWSISFAHSEPSLSHALAWNHRAMVCHHQSARQENRSTRYHSLAYHHRVCCRCGRRCHQRHVFCATHVSVIHD